MPIQAQQQMEEPVTEEDMINWIDGASYSQLLTRWRYSENTSGWFSGKVCEHFRKVRDQRKAELSMNEHMDISRKVGFRRV